MYCNCLSFGNVTDGNAVGPYSILPSVPFVNTCPDSPPGIFNVLAIVRVSLVSSPIVKSPSILLSTIPEPLPPLVKDTQEPAL